MLPDLHDLRDFHDEAGRLLDRPRGTIAHSGPVQSAHISKPVVATQAADNFQEPERHDEYLRRLKTLEAAGKINPDGSWNHNS